MEHTEKKIIDLWLKQQQQIHPQAQLKTELPVETLIDLLDKLHYNKCKKLSKAKIINNNTKQILQIYTNDFSQYFYKKQINSNWTYLKYHGIEYDIKWNIVLYVYQCNNKSYNPKQKPMTKKNNKKIESSTKKKSKCKVKDYFDILSDSECD